MGKILVIDDDALTRALLLSGHDGHDWVFLEQGSQSLTEAVHHMPNLIVMDVTLSQTDGMSLFLELRTDVRTSTIPIIIVTAAANICSKIEALKLGADDYLAKPFSSTELILRISAILRRSEAARQRLGSFLLDRITGTVYYEDTPIKLTTTEFRLFAALLSERGRVHTRQNLLREVWGHTDDFHSRTLDTHIKRLRRRLGVAGNLILNVKGVGYQLLSRTPTSEPPP